MNGKLSKTGRTHNGWVNVYDSNGFQAGENIAASATSLLGIVATNKAASGVAWLMIFDSTVAPSGAPSMVPIAVPFGQTVSVSYNDVVGNGHFGVTTLTGLSWGASTSPTTYTADATDLACSIRYIA